jgi:hypothetical protein
MKASPSKHWLLAVDQKRQLVAYVCDVQPLATIRSYGHPVRCPFCRCMSPLTAGGSTIGKPLREKG